jgi:hypothetical protein
MIDIVRRLEYNFLKTSLRKDIGKYVKTITQSCQLHDSNLINVQLSRMLRHLDTTRRDPFNHALSPAIPEIKGNKKTECFSINTARFIASSIKKNKVWKAFMLDEYGDGQGIKSIKSARFWSVMIIMGTYLYPRMKFLKEFAAKMKGALVGKQLGGNLADMLRNEKLFEFDCLMEGVDYKGFHSPFNYSASNSTAQDQAKYVKEVVTLHKRCEANTSERNTYWRTHAEDVIVDRRFLEWTCEHFATHRKHASEQEQQQQRATIKAAVTAEDLAIPPGCQDRVKCMHTAVVMKCEEFLTDIVATGTVDYAVRKSNAPPSNMRVECVL